MISDMVDGIFGEGSSRVVLPPEAVLCCLYLRSVEKLIKLKGDVHKKRRGDQNESEASWTGLLWA